MGLIRVYHDSLGHSGVGTVAQAMKQHFSWIKMGSDVAAFIYGCEACQIHNTLPIRVEPPHLYDLLGPFQHVCMDYCGPFPYVDPTTGKSSKAWVAVMVDYFTKTAEFVIVHDKTAGTAARVIYDHWLTRYPKPRKWTTDHGTEFGFEVTSLLNKLGIEHAKCAVLNPKGNGAAERLVQSLKRMLKRWVSRHTQHWALMLPAARGAYMRRVHKTTGVAPMQFLFTMQPELLLPLGLTLQPTVGVVGVSDGGFDEPSGALDKIDARPSLDVAAQAREILFRSAYKNIASAQLQHRMRYIELAIQRAERQVFEVVAGDFVLVLLDNAEGLRPQFAGPFQVHSVTAYGNVVVSTTTEGTNDEEAKLWSVNPRRVVPYHASPIPPLVDWLPDPEV
jgi:transposase InsO family protein